MASTLTIEAQIIGTSSVLRAAVRRLATVARVHRLPVLIEGETGTGKELAAQLVHRHSRRLGRFVAINCSALPTDLLESELFGYARGAFSGASREHVGLFEQAHRGTLFLDEIGELPLALQPKLLRAIQDGEIRRLGSNDMRTIDVRIVAATHRSLGEMVAARTFRDDLLYRLRGYVVRLPPLRERGHDVVHLARRFLGDQFPRTRISRAAEAVLRAYAWPGNVRELQHVVWAAGVDAGRTLRPEHLAGHLDHRASPFAPRASRADQVLAVVDRLEAASPREMRHATSLPRTTLQRALTDLVAAGILRRVGDGRGTRYTRADAAPGAPLSTRQHRILRYVENASRITRLECAKATGASLRTASRDLRQLVERGYLIPDGRAGNAAGYRVARLTGPFVCRSATVP